MKWIRFSAKHDLAIDLRTLPCISHAASFSCCLSSGGKDKSVFVTGKSSGAIFSSSDVEPLILSLLYMLGSSKVSFIYTGS